MNLIFLDLIDAVIIGVFILTTVLLVINCFIVGICLKETWLVLVMTMFSYNQLIRYLLFIEIYPLRK